MAALLAHRGPDDHGEAIIPIDGDRAAVLAHRRLSIIDIPGGHQPLRNEDGSVQVDLQRRDLQLPASCAPSSRQRGHTLRDASDTEVIVHLYEEYGDDCVDHLRGMFAFALWDSRRRAAACSRATGSASSRCTTRFPRRGTSRSRSRAS